MIIIFFITFSKKIFLRLYNHIYDKKINKINKKFKLFKTLL